MARKFYWLAAAHFGLLALAATPVATAQQADDDEADSLEEIVVTGSRIRRDEFSSSTPITVINGQAIIDQGVSNVGEALRQQAAAGTGGFNQSSILSGGGATSVDLRNLGQSRVLILINGRRVASFADALANQSADLTFVPTAMVDRVEILRDGASAVYGSDAITGVINVILKKDFDGVELSLQSGATGEGDGEHNSIALTMGVAGDRGNFVAGGEYRQQDPIKQRDRDWAIPTISALNANGAVNGSVFSPGGLFLGDGGAVFCTRAVALGGDERTDVSGTDPTFCGLNTRENVGSPDQVSLLRYDYALNQDLIIDSEVFTTSLFGNYELSDNTNVFLESQFAKRLGTSHLDGNPGSFGTPSFPDGSRVPATNPNNPTGEDGLFLFRPTSTIGPRTSEQESNTIRLVAGIEGDLPFIQDWFYEASFLYTRVDAELQTNYVWNLARFVRISDPDLCAADSLCSATVNPSGALDAFRPANWTQQEIEYLRHVGGGISKFETTGGAAFASGPLFELPAGTVNVALGIESRKDVGFNQPDAVTEAGESVGNQVFTTQGDLQVDEVFAELDVPLLADMPLAQSMVLNLQWRISDYDTFGSEDVYRIGLDWGLADWIRIRANTSTAYRAPQVTDMFGGGTVSFDFFDPDICDAAASGIQPGSNAYQNCVLDGIDPDAFTQPSAQYAVLAGSNPNLLPETADTATYGFVIEPGGILEGLQASVDFWDIEVADLISRPTSQSVLDDCYEGPVGLTAPECAQFSRNPNTGVPISFVNRLVNLSNVETNGVDVGISYGLELGATDWTFDLRGTYVDENTFFPFAGGADDRGSIPRYIGNFRTDVAFRDWMFSWSMRFISGMDDAGFDGTDNSFGYDGPPSYQNHSLRATYNWTDKWRLLVGINNVLDEEPPYVFSSSNNTDTLLYDVFGRFWFARLTYSGSAN